MTRLPEQPFFTEQDCSIDSFEACLKQSIDDSPELRFTSSIEQAIAVYHADDIAATLADNRSALLAEWFRVFDQGSGIVVIRQAYQDASVIDRLTDLFNQIIEDERMTSAGDHFAASGSNDRIWNAHQKACIRDPQGYSLYYANEYIDAVNESWLGPNYQLTAQVNQVRPGGKAQQPHRDYHLGFQSNAEASRYPANVHLISQYLTLQGAVAHTDMPIASGPTKLLPYSQHYLPGYLAWRQQPFIDYFESHQVQLELHKGDLLYFNPAVFHAAGENRTSDCYRMANLIQVSSAFGYPMETLDRTQMCKQIYPELIRIAEESKLSAEQIDCVIKATARAYPFPTSLDTDPPLDQLTPQSQAQLMRQALAEHWSQSRLEQQLDAQVRRTLGKGQ